MARVAETTRGCVAITVTFDFVVIGRNVGDDTFEPLVGTDTILIHWEPR